MKTEIDYDLEACLRENSIGISVSDIEKVIAVHEGEGDEDDWRWIVKLSIKDKTKRFAFIQGGCDHTGWNCQSWATCGYAKTAKQAAKFALGNVPLANGSDPLDAGLGHMLKIISGEYTSNFDSVYQELMEQIKAGSKKETWTEQMDREFNTASIPKVK